MSPVVNVPGIFKKNVFSGFVLFFFFNICVPFKLYFQLIHIMLFLFLFDPQFLEMHVKTFPTTVVNLCIFFCLFI